MTKQLLFCWVLLPEFAQKSTQLFLCSSYLSFSQGISLKFKWCSHTIVLIRLLHINPWPSRQSEILCIERKCENKRKQSRGWTEMCGCLWNDIFGCPREIRAVCQCESWVSVYQTQLAAINEWSVTGAPVIGWALRWGQRPTERLRSYGSV